MQQLLMLSLCFATCYVAVSRAWSLAYMADSDLLIQHGPTARTTAGHHNMGHNGCRLHRAAQPQPVLVVEGDGGGRRAVVAHTACHEDDCG